MKKFEKIIQLKILQQKRVFIISFEKISLYQHKIIKQSLHSIE